ncbi:MAG: putative nucleotidyltransferase substrate binding domain-containing protein, partial [Nitrospirota bacterium]
DLFEKGVRPLVDSVRVFSLEKKITELPTLKRLKALKERYGFEQAQDSSQALEYLFTLVIHDQLAQAGRGAPPDSFLNPEDLSNLERKTLKETFMLIAEMYDIIEKGYRTERVGG